MYRYDEFDETLVRERTKQFRGQVERRLKGELREENFKPLRLQNGVYLQLHSYMFRIAVPYGQLNAARLRQLALIARQAATRAKATSRHARPSSSNLIRSQHPRRERIRSTTSEMHTIKTSGNCIRQCNVRSFCRRCARRTRRPLALVRDIVASGRPSTRNSRALPRKFKIARDGRSARPAPP